MGLATSGCDCRPVVEGLSLRGAQPAPFQVVFEWTEKDVSLVRITPLQCLYTSVPLYTKRGMMPMLLEVFGERSHHSVQGPETGLQRVVLSRHL